MEKKKKNNNILRTVLMLIIYFLMQHLADVGVQSDLTADSFSARHVFGEKKKEL